MRKSSDIGLCLVRTVSDHLALHAHSCVVRVQLSCCVSTRRHALSHLEEWVHLLLCAHLTTEDAVSSKIVGLVQVGARSNAEAADALPAAHDAARALTLQRRGLVDGPAEGVLPLPGIRAADHLLRGLVGAAQSAGLVWLHRRYVLVYLTLLLR